MTEPSNPEPSLEIIHQRVRSLLYDLTGRQDLQGVEIAGLIRRIANAYEINHERHMTNCDLSGPRLGLLMRIEWEERTGNQNGVTPTALSHNQRVSRNTISALLNGLESQGLIERRLDPEDRRGFRIRLTDLGRQTVTDTAPRLIDHHNRMTCSLTEQEQSQLIELLTRLYSGLVGNYSASSQPGSDLPAGSAD